MQTYSDAVVLAAGEGTGLLLTEDKPKGMVEVADEPLLTPLFRGTGRVGCGQAGGRGGLPERRDHRVLRRRVPGRAGDLRPPARAEGAGPRAVDCRGTLEDDFMLMLGNNIF